jgi:DNA-binding NarL/FixJ family response regulator
MDTYVMDRSVTTPASHDLLEQALVAGLAALAELSREAGQPVRAGRLREAVAVLRADAAPQPMPRGREHTPVKLPVLLVGATAHATRCPLTTREHEVADLVGHGLTNRQIAEQLIISDRTVDTHVQNILSKLGLVSRAQIGFWVAEHAFGLATDATGTSLVRGCTVVMGRQRD